MQEELARIEAKIAEAEGLLKDPEMGLLVIDELRDLKQQKAELEKAIAASEQQTKDEVLQEDFNTVLVEARQGVGGDEAKIWAEDLLRMYTRFASLKNWKIEILDEGVIQIHGKGSFKALKFETGVHRVQRVPETEAAGRIHTSTASIVVLPEVPESRVEVKEDDLLWEFTRGGGHGGQNVNKVATAVRVTHKPTGLIAQSRQERTQEQNRKIALSLLRAQLWEKEQEAKAALVADQRLAIGSSSRSEKIRTYNYPQNRVTDHRINKSWHDLDRIMEGNIEDVIESLQTTPVAPPVSIIE
jgi:peptide chain release factor 1